MKERLPSSSMRAGRGGHRGPSTPQTPLRMTQKMTQRSEEADRLIASPWQGEVDASSSMRRVRDRIPNSHWHSRAVWAGWTPGSFDSADSAQDDTKIGRGRQTEYVHDPK